MRSFGIYWSAFLLLCDRQHIYCTWLEKLAGILPARTDATGTLQSRNPR